jgi:hypothetical protein
MNLHTNHENNKKLQTMEFEERSGGNREWHRLRISLAFQHRFVIRRENIMCQ